MTLSKTTANPLLLGINKDDCEDVYFLAIKDYACVTKVFYNSVQSACVSLASENNEISLLK